jgi:hypothetical protein
MAVDARDRRLAAVRVRVRWPVGARQPRRVPDLPDRHTGGLVRSPIWLSWLRDDAVRNFAALVVVGVGYAAYCVEAVLGSRSRGENVHLHYFAAAGVALILVVLHGAMTPHSWCVVQ